MIGLDKLRSNSGLKTMKTDQALPIFIFVAGLDLFGLSSAGTHRHVKPKTARARAKTSTTAAAAAAAAVVVAAIEKQW